ncbi:MAG: hypothetical protein FRX49_05127 [Trebouxia sp. A1-2]|nr:MAG: hypothetical protein FRX49_05127 [Trebouxia sp. A1-2]
MVVQIKVSGDPRRPNETHAFKMLPPTAEDQTPGALLLLAIGFGMAALLLKVKACAWAGVVCVVMCVANINSADLDVKSIMSAGSFAILGLASSYMQAPAGLAGQK